MPHIEKRVSISNTRQHKSDLGVGMTDCVHSLLDQDLTPSSSPQQASLYGKEGIEGNYLLPLATCYLPTLASLTGPKGPSLVL